MGLPPFIDEICEDDEGRAEDEEDVSAGDSSGVLAVLGCSFSFVIFGIFGTFIRIWASAAADEQMINANSAATPKHICIVLVITPPEWVFRRNWEKLTSRMIHATFKEVISKRAGL